MHRPDNRPDKGERAALEAGRGHLKRRRSVSFCEKVALYVSYEIFTTYAHWDEAYGHRKTVLTDMMR